MGKSPWKHQDDDAGALWRRGDVGRRHYEGQEFQHICISKGNNLTRYHAFSYSPDHSGASDPDELGTDPGTDGWTPIRADLRHRPTRAGQPPSQDVVPARTRCCEHRRSPRARHLVAERRTCLAGHSFGWSRHPVTERSAVIGRNSDALNLPHADAAGADLAQDDLAHLGRTSQEVASGRETQALNDAPFESRAHAVSGLSHEPPEKAIVFSVDNANPRLHTWR